MALQQLTKPAIKSVQVMLSGENLNLIIGSDNKDNHAYQKLRGNKY